ncbi:MAG TPA: WD40 repeat domain-containing serine/threonine-protein kinase, partial [bacterium]|nr:WD40 repeat domain-containing serine/threonine-protein kinase [bacterium]
VIKGNAKFMAPEQVCGSAMDARTDVYGAGMVLFTLLAGKNPFDDLPLPAILDRVIKGAIPVPSAFNADVPPALDQIVEHATKISPRLRYASAAEFQGALEGFAREMKLNPRAKALADLIEGLDDTRRTRPGASASGSPSIVARLGPLIAESVAASGGSLITTLGKISNPERAASPEDTEPETHARSGTLITRAPPGALTKGQGRMLGHRQAVSAVAVAPNGLVGISGSHDQTVIVWDLVNRIELRQIRAHSAAVTALALAADGVTLVTASRDKTLKVFDASTGEARATLTGHTGWVFAVAISSDDHYALSGSFDHTARLWDLRTRKPVATLEGHRDSVASVAFSADGGIAVTGSYDKTVRIWDLASLREKRAIRTDDSVRAAAVSRDGSTALSAGADSVIRLWDLTWGTEINSFVGHREPVVALAFSPDGKRALSGSYDGTVRLWSIDAGECLATFEGPREPVLSVAFGPDGRFALSGGGDGAVTIWELP